MDLWYPMVIFYVFCSEVAFGVILLRGTVTLYGIVFVSGGHSTITYIELFLIN